MHVSGPCRDASPPLVEAVASSAAAGIGVAVAGIEAAVAAWAVVSAWAAIAAWAIAAWATAAGATALRGHLRRRCQRGEFFRP